MKLFFVAPLFLFCVCLVASGQTRPPASKATSPTPERKTFVSEEFGFSVVFPGNHWLDGNAEMPGSMVRGSEFKSLVLDVKCAVSVSDSLVPVGQTDFPAQFFDKLEMTFRKTKGVQFFNRSVVTNGAYEGVEFNYLYGGKTIRLRSWIIGSRIYDVTTEVPANIARNSGLRARQTKIADDFFASFKITNPPKVTPALAVLPTDFDTRIEDGHLIVGRLGFSMDLPIGFEEVEAPLGNKDDVRPIIQLLNNDPDHLKSLEVFVAKLIAVGASPVVLAQIFATNLPDGAEIEVGPTMTPLDNVRFGYVGYQDKTGFTTRLFVTERAGMVFVIRYSCQQRGDLVIFDELMKSVRLTKGSAATPVGKE